MAAEVVLSPVIARRRVDWPERLASFVESRRAQPFAWGANDCITFAADAVAAMTDSDVMDAWRGHYTTSRGAARLLNKLGGVRGAATAVLGEPIAPTFAQRGDVVLLANGGRDCLGVCAGLVAAAPAADGVAWQPMSAALAAWRV